MRKNIFLALLLLFISAFSPLLSAADAEDTAPHPLNTLETNRSLVNQYREEYERLKNEEKADPSGTVQRKLRDLEDKIRMLEQDYQERRASLPADAQASEFIGDLMAKKIRAEKIKENEKAKKILEKTASERSAYEMHEQALKLVSEKNFKEALKIYEEIVLRNPDDDEAYIIMGHSYLLTGQHQKAENAFHNAVNIDPKNIDAITPFYENMVMQNPEDDMAFAYLGYAYLIVGDLVKARDAFKEALQINPKNIPARDGASHTDQLISGA